GGDGGRPLPAQRRLRRAGGHGTGTRTRNTACSLARAVLGQPPEVCMNAIPKQAPAALEVHGLTRRYGALTAVNEVSLACAPGEILCLLGSSGCGKSTLLRLIAGLEAPDAGSVVMDGRVLADTTRFVPPEQRGIGLVFQDYALFPHLSILDNVAFGLKGPKAARHAAARAALERVR